MSEHKVNGSEGAREGGLDHDVLKKNRNFYIGVGGTVLEGLLSGSLFMLLYSVMQLLWSGQFDMNRALILTGVDRKSTRLNSSHLNESRMPSSA